MNVNRKRMRSVWALLLVLGLTGPAYAVDGVIEINQARAKAGGVTPGDTPLFPVTISQPGSYRLTGNLDVTDASARPAGVAPENTTAILVTASNVTIDLNGFMIKGPTVCSSDSGICDLTSGSGRGIDAWGLSGSQSRITVVNGTVEGMGGDYGIVLPLPSTVENVLAVSNRGGGINAQTVTGSKAEYNGGAGGSPGIFAQAVSGSVAWRNHADGIIAYTVSTSTAIGNSGTGIRGPYNQPAATVTGCTAISNSVDGINALTVTGCTATYNGVKGIVATTATGCTATANGGSEQISAKGLTGQNMCSSDGTTFTTCP